MLAVAIGRRSSVFPRRPSGRALVSVRRSRRSGGKSLAKRRTTSNGSGNGRPSADRPGSNGSRAASRRTAANRAAAPKPGGNGVHAAPQSSLPRTRFSSDELEAFRRLLIEKRRELAGDVDHMENEALRRTRTDASGDLSMMPIHMADIGTDNYEQEFTIGLIAGERATLREIDEALQRIDDRTYGVCLATHKPIGKARLKARPWSKYCIEYVRAQEARSRGRLGM